VAFNSLHLGWDGACAEGFGYALLAVRAVVEMDFHEKRMLAAAIIAMNVDFVCRHDALFIANLASAVKVLSCALLSLSASSLKHPGYSTF